MVEKKTNWIRDLLFLPLMVGLIVAFITFGLPVLFDKEKELSYSIETPTEYLDQEAVKNINVQVNGTTVTSLFAYKVHNGIQLSKKWHFKGCILCSAMKACAIYG
jgi:hypothetical protein